MRLRVVAIVSALVHAAVAVAEPVYISYDIQDVGPSAKSQRHAQVEVPEGLREGEAFRVETADGNKVTLMVPEGLLPGSVMTFAYSPHPPPPPMTGPVTGQAEVPDSAREGDKFQVQTPDGQMFTLTVPWGVDPGTMLSFTYTPLTNSKQTLLNQQLRTDLADVRASADAPLDPRQQNSDMAELQPYLKSPGAAGITRLNTQLGSKVADLRRQLATMQANDGEAVADSAEVAEVEEEVADTMKKVEALQLQINELEGGRGRGEAPRLRPRSSRRVSPLELGSRVPGNRAAEIAEEPVEEQEFAESPAEEEAIALAGALGAAAGPEEAEAGIAQLERQIGRLEVARRPSAAVLVTAARPRPASAAAATLAGANSRGGGLEPRSGPAPATASITPAEKPADELQQPEAGAAPAPDVAKEMLAELSFRKGENVKLWSDRKRSWINGVVVEVQDNRGPLKHYPAPPGVVKVYSDEEGVRFVVPRQYNSLLRKEGLVGKVKDALRFSKQPIGAELQPAPLAPRTMKDVDLPRGLIDARPQWADPEPRPEQDPLQDVFTRSLEDGFNPNGYNNDRAAHQERWNDMVNLIKKQRRSQDGLQTGAAGDASSADLKPDPLVGDGAGPLVDKLVTGLPGRVPNFRLLSLDE